MPTLYYELTRHLANGDTEYPEVAVHFTSRCTAKAYAADRIDPPWPAEWEHQVNSIEMVDPTTAPLKPAERAEVAAWFPSQAAECDELAEVDAADEFFDRADYEYELRRDERMEWAP